MELSGKTRVLGIFGYPVEHTLSPIMQNTALNVLGIDMCYLAFRVLPRDLPDAIRSVRALNMAGVNITVPHKENVIPLLDGIDEEAAFIGAVNTVVNTGEELRGFNTDGKGFMRSLSEEGLSAEGKKILILGAGGASRAVSYYLSRKASSIALFDIDEKKSDKLAHDLRKIGGNISSLKSIDSIEDPDMVINATPLGLKPGDPLPLEPEAITPKMTVCDLVYRKTGLLGEAERRGARTLDGSGMLLWQGVLAFEMWTGAKPPVDLMRRALLSRIR